MQGRWAGREGGAEGRSRGLQHGSDGAAVAALLSSRRRLYDAMESSLLDKGLALGKRFMECKGRTWDGRRCREGAVRAQAWWVLPRLPAGLPLPPMPPQALP